MENTKIEWANHTFNPWEGCQKVGPGCDHCYAETRNARFAGGVAINWGPGAQRRRTSASNWAQPLKWNAEAERLGVRHRVFCASLADVFDNAVDDMWRLDLFALIAKTPHLDWLLLTKRIGNVTQMLADAIDFDDTTDIPDWPWPNVWIGATIVNQEEADRDIPKLLAVPAARRFLSMEPLLGPVELNGHEYSVPNSSGLGEGIDWLTGRISQYSDIFGGYTSPWLDRGDFTFPADHKTPRIDWVIVGGESGPGARPMHPDWARSLRDQCEAAGVPFLFKQWGDWLPAKDGRSITGHVLILDGAAPFAKNPEWYGFEDGQRVARVGKKAAGRMLDGRTWDGVPS